MNDIDTTQLARWLAATDIAELELHSPAGHVRLRSGAARTATGREALSGFERLESAGTAEPAATRGTAAAAIAPISAMATASSVGLFLDRHPLRAAPFVKTGDAVTEGQTVGLLRIGTLLLPVTAPCGGIAGAWHVAPGTAVGYGTALLDIASPGDAA